MIRTLWRALLVVLATSLAAGVMPAQEIILPYNRTPETAEETWAAVKYELNLGNHQRTAAMLSRFYDRLLARNEADQDRLLLRIYDTEGMSAFLRLSTIATVREGAKARTAEGKDVAIPDILVSRVSKLVEARLSDMARIQFFVKNLAGSPEERAYAITQLRQAGNRAVPAMVAVLRDPNKERAHPYVTFALMRMDSDITPPLLAALDDNNPNLRSMILNVLYRRNDARVIPALWWLFGAKDVPETLHKQIQHMLTNLTNASTLGDPREALTQIASDYYYPSTKPPVPENMVWRWDGQEVVGQAVTSPQYKEYYGLYWARKALELDPAYRPAQIMFLNIALEHTYSRLSANPAEPLDKVNPQLAQVLAGAGSQLLEQVLAQALKDNRTWVALGAAKALAKSGDVRLLRATEKGEPALSQALRYPDQRVRLAAAEAVVHIPQAGSFPGASRVVAVLKRALTAGDKPKALVGFPRSQEGQTAAALVLPLGYTADVVTTGRELVRRANDEGDVSLILLDPKLAEPQLPYILTELKNNPNTSGIPIVILAEPEQARQIRGQVARHGRILVMTPPPATPEKFKGDLEDFLKSPPLTAEERKAQAKLALELLLRIARGEVPGYDLRLADDAMARALADDELAPSAASVLALRPGRANQQALADVALTNMRPAPVRAAAADAVRLNVQRYGILLGPKELAGLVQLPAVAQEPELQTAAARLAAQLQPDASGEGQRLKAFNPLPGAAAPADKGQPVAPPPPPPPPGKVDDKEKDK
jgi:CheY-like chemotaxis protein/HEAT repeat protein